jgi:hypothetical protein
MRHNFQFNLVRASRLKRSLLLTFVAVLAGSAVINAQTLEIGNMVPMPVHPNSVTVGDFNNDGIPDLVVPSWSPNQVSILLGTGTGVMSAPLTYGLGGGGGPRFAVVADFNADGNADVATANEGTANVSILFGNGAGGLTNIRRVPAGSAPYHLAVGYLNGDNIADLVVANSGATTISILLGSGNGNFVSAGTPVTGASPHAVCIADLNGDTHPDIAVSNFGSQNVGVLHGDGNGGFGPVSVYPVGANPFTLAAGDLNGDGRLDLAVPNFGSTTVSILLGNAGAGFVPATAVTAGKTPRAVVIRDFDADGFADLAVANRESTNVTLHRGNGAGAFTSAGQFGVGSGPFSLLAADMNGDGLSDIAVADRDGHTVSVLNAVSAFDFHAPAAYPVGNNPRGVASGDFDGDGVFDLAVANNVTNTMSVLRGLGAGKFAPAVSYAAAQGSWGVAVGDVNGDGIQDVIVSNASNNCISVYRGNGTGGFLAQQKWNTGSGPRSVTVADFDADGKLDIATANFGGNSVSVLRGTGNGNFAAQTAFAVGAGPTGIVAGDLTGDGKVDLAVSNGTANTVSVLVGTGTGSFAPATSVSVGTTPSSITSGDFDADGDLDLAVSNENSNTITVLSGNGAGGFSSVFALPTGTRPLGIATADVTADSILDIVVANATTNTVTVHAGVGNGTFGPVATFPAGTFARALALADFDGDSLPDIAVANANSNDTWILMNRSGAAADLSVAISNGETAVTAGNAVAYTVTVTNLGPAAITALGLDLNVSAGLELSGIQAAAGSYNSGTGAWTGLNLAGGDSVTLTIDGSVSITAPVTVEISASVTPPIGVSDPSPANNSAADLDTVIGGVPGNTAPVAIAQSVSVQEDGSVAITLSANDAESDPITYTIQQAPAHGLLTGTAPNLTYTPTGNYSGADSFIFRASDGTLSSTATVTITVNAVNDAPVANGQSLVTNEDVALPLILSGTDADGNPLTYSIVTPPTLGILTGAGANRTYTPNANVSGADSFTFTVSDGTVQSAPATVTLQVNAVNDTPVVVTPIADQSVTGDVTLVSVNLASTFSDVETAAGALVLSAVSGDPSLATPLFNGSTLELQLDPSRSGTTTITVRATDSQGAWIQDTFNIVVMRAGLNLSVADASRAEGGGGVVFTVTLSAASTLPVTVGYATDNVTAIAGADYAATSGTLTFAPGITSRTVTIPLLADVLDEDNETFRLVLNSPNGATLNDGEGIGTILDDDTATLSFADITVNEGDASTTAATFVVTLSTPSSRDVTVNFATANISGGAIAGSDYVANSGTLTFLAGSNTPQNVTVDVIGDVLDEPDQAFSFTLSGALNGVIGRALGRATILDNDASPTVSISDVSITEGNSGTKAMNFTLTLSAPSEIRSRVQYQTADGTATAGSDYVAKTGEVVFDPGITTRTVTIVINGDVSVESAETLLVNLHTPTSLTIADGQAAGTIQNDD